eukprot:10099081-Lingulodinium_polyedra.AAC.1
MKDLRHVDDNSVLPDMASLPAPNGGAQPEFVKMPEYSALCGPQAHLKRAVHKRQTAAPTKNAQITNTKRPLAQSK